MPRFKYRAVDKDGKPHTGEATAKTSDPIQKELRERGLTVLEIQEVVEEKKTATLADKVALDFGVSRKDLSMFTRQLATTLNAGIPLMRIVHVLRRRNPNYSLRRVLDAVAQDLQQGLSFSQALAKHTKVFDETFLNMTKVGEVSGNLPETITRLATMLEKEVAVQRKISGALAYPVFILIFTSCLSYGMVAFLMPLFIPMLEGSGLDIRNQYPLTYFLITLSKIASDRTYIVGGSALLIGLVVGYRMMYKLPRGRYLIDLVKFNIPFLSGLIQQGVTARFARSFSLLLQSGVPMLQAMSLVSAAAGNRYVQNRLEHAALEIKEGGKLSETLDKTKLFPDLLVQMVTIGEESGSLPEMLENVAEYYEAEIDATITALTSILEPAMMIIVGGIVGFFIMGVLLPIMGISQAVEGGMRK